MNDGEILERLGDALRSDVHVAPRSAPSGAEIAALVGAVHERTVVTSRRGRRVVVSVAAVAGLVACSTGVAMAATGGAVANPVRRAAHNVGLPIDSPELSDARSKLRDLREALSAKDHSRIASTAADLRSGVTGLDQREREQLGEVNNELGQADADINQQGDQGQQSGHPGQQTGASNQSSGDSPDRGQTGPATSPTGGGGQQQTPGDSNSPKDDGTGAHGGEQRDGDQQTEPSQPQQGGSGQSGSPDRQGGSPQGPSQGGDTPGANGNTNG